MKKLLLSILLLSVSFFVACGGSSGSSVTPPPTVTLISITLTPASPSIAVRTTQQFKATGNYSDGTTKDLTATANWLSGTSSVATVNVSGLATGMAAGTSTISASSASVTGTTTLTVTNPLVSIAVTPLTATVAPTATQQYTATGTYADGSTQNITSTVTWASSLPGVATITSAGLATGIASGTSSITASFIQNGATITSPAATLTVSAALVSIAVTPTTATVAPNATQQFTATGAYSDGTHKNITSSVTWAATTGATITAGGLATGVTPGATSTITATSGTVSGTATLTVTNPLVSIAVTPLTITVAPNGTQQFTATGTYANGSTNNITSSVTWKASAGATITSGGLATGVTPGATSTISATSGTVSGTATLTVTNPLVSIAVTPSAASVSPIPPNNTQQFTATGTYADGSTKNITSSVTWSASTGATITSGGLATGVTPNATVTIMAAQGNISGTATLTITNPLVSIAVTPPSPSIAAGTTQQFTATGTYADNSTQVITSTVTWASSKPNFATISNSQGTNGLATGVAAGTTSITAQAGSIISPPATLTVTSATLVSIAVTPASTIIPLATQQQYTATGTFSDSTTQNITNIVTWTSSDPAHITIVASGLATGVAVTNNPVTITATKGTIFGTASATVSAANLVSIVITPTTANLAVGTSRQYNAIGTFNNGSTLNVTNQAVWASNPGTNATVSKGLVNALTGNCTTSCPETISATLGSISGSITIDVNNVTVTAMTVTPISPTIPVGVTERFYAVATFSDGTSQDVSSNATWGSDNNPVATVNSPGIASGISSGTAHISASFGGQSGTATLTVSTATLVSIAVTPSQTILTPASVVSFQATGTYSDQSTQNLTGLATWTSSNTNVVTVVADGTATGQGAGTATITAAYQGVTSNSGGSVIGTNSPLVSIAVTPPAPSVPEDVTLGFAAVGTFADSTQQSLTSNVIWASGQPAVATISNVAGQQGQATGVATGQTAITAVFAGIVGNDTLNVTSATIDTNGITVNPANSSVSVGTQVNFTAKGTFSDGSVIDLTNQVTWSSSMATVATINPGGVANAATPGTTSISAAFIQNGPPVTGMTNLTVH